jgi:hypothetical protein
MVFDWECAHRDEDAEYGMGTCGVGHAPKEAIKVGHDHDCFGLLGRSQKTASCWTAGERLAGANPWILEDLDETESLHVAVGGDPLALGFETQAAISLFFAGHTDVAEGVFHGVFT